MSHLLEIGSEDRPLNIRAILDLHLAEYQALTARCTAWMSWQIGMWPLVVLFLALMFQAHGIIPIPTLVWLSLLGVQIILFTYAHMMYEQFMAVRYIEVDLRARVAELVPRHPFWGYELYLVGRRGPVELAPDWFMGAALLTIVLGLAVATFPRQWFDLATFVTNLGVSTLIGVKTLKIIRIRREFSSPPIALDAK